MHPQSVADGTGTTEFNIDGKADGQIYNKLQEIGINITTYKWKKATDNQAAKWIVAGFTGTLRNLQDDYLTEQNTNVILNV